MYLCCQYSLHSTHWYLSEREREVFLGFIILQFLCSLHLEEVPSIVQMKLNTAALLHFIMWFFGIFQLLHFFCPENSIYLKKRRKPAWSFCCVFFCHQATTNNILMVKYVVYLLVFVHRYVFQTTYFSHKFRQIDFLTLLGVKHLS